MARHSRRVAKIVPAESDVDVDQEFMGSADWIIHRYRGMFDPFAEL